MTDLQQSQVGSHILQPYMQQLELAKLNLTKLQKEGFPGIDPFNQLSQESLLEEEEDALSAYGEKEPMLRDFSIRYTIAPDPNSLISQHKLAERKIYLPSVIVWRSKTFCDALLCSTRSSTTLGYYVDNEYNSSMGSHYLR